MSRRIRGDVGFLKLIRQLPSAARDEMGDMLDGAGAQLAQAIKADTPVRTGVLRQAITWQLLRKSLKLRVGLIGRRSNRDLFYGRIVEFGRRGQTAKAARRFGGKVVRYSVRVKARAGHPFVYKRRPNLRDQLGGRLRNYWNDVLARAGEGVSFDD